MKEHFIHQLSITYHILIILSCISAYLLIYRSYINSLASFLVSMLQHFISQCQLYFTVYQVFTQNIPQINKGFQVEPGTCVLTLDICSHLLPRLEAGGVERPQWVWPASGAVYRAR